MTEQTASPRVPAWDVADRMRKGLREADLSIQEIADYLGVARNTVSTWINGHIQPSTQTLRLWAMRCGTPYEWLAYGTPEIHVPAAKAIAEPGLNWTEYRIANRESLHGLLSAGPARTGPCAVPAAA
jgi:transcriptional regulator with XRE-family HTH domain